MPLVELNEHAFLCQAADGGGNADAGREVDAHFAAHFLHVAGFDNSPGDFAREALAEVGGVVGEVEVGVAHAAGIVGAAHFGIHTEGEAAVYGLGGSEFAVATGTDGGAGHHVYLKRTAGGVLAPGALGQRGRYHLGRTGRTETAHCEQVAVVDKGGRVGGCEFGNNHSADFEGQM